MKDFALPLSGGESLFAPSLDIVQDDTFADLRDASFAHFTAPITPFDAFTGTTGNDTITGTAGDDTIDISQGGTDTAYGLAGNDTIILGGKLHSTDHIDGGDGYDTVQISGGYTGLVLGATTIVNVEYLQVLAGHNYNITTNDGNVAAGQNLTIDASQLGAANTLTFNGSAETDGSFNVFGGAGNDVITGSSTADYIDASHGGNDVINTGGAATDPNGYVDDVYFGAALTAADQVNGVDGQTEVDLQGDYSAGLTLGASTLTNIGTLYLISGSGESESFSYNITTNDATVAAGQALSVIATDLTASETLTFNGSAETNGDFLIYGGAGNDHLVGGAGNDYFKPGAGDDYVDGGAGKNRVTFSDDHNGVTVSLLVTTAQNTGDGMDTLKNIQDVSGSTGNDTLTGDGNANWLWGEGGSDTIMGNGGNDLIQVGSNGTGTIGTDVADGGTAHNTLSFDDNGNGSPGVTFSLALQGSQQATGEDNLTASNFIDVSGTSGNDVITGDANGNTLYGAAGDDTLSGGAGNDVLYGDKLYEGSVSGAGGDGPAGATDADPGTGGDDVLIGGTGNDVLNGGEGSNTASYADATSGVKVDLTISAAQSVGGGDGKDTLVDIQNLIGSAYNDVLTGDSNDNTLSGGAGNDQFHTGGGNDTVNGGDGNDIVYFDAAGTLTFNGGAGTDTLNTTLVSFDTVWALSDDVENFVGGSGGETVGVTDPTAMVARNFAGGGGDDSLAGGAANDKLDGGDGNDTLDISAGGNDVVTGDAGDDTIIAGAALTAADKIDGGTGNNTLELNGDYSTTLSFSATSFVNIQTITLGAGYSYKLATNDHNVGPSQILTVDGSALGASDVLTFNGSHETDGSFILIGGAGNDSLIGGAGADTFTGGAGADKMTGESGGDTFVYTAVTDSTGLNHDVIAGFDGSTDIFLMPVSVSAINAAVTSGALSSSHFDANLAAAVGSAQLGADDAVIFTPNSGTLAGHTYLIVDANGVAGYQAGQDYVIELTSATNLASLTTANFTHVS